MPSYQFPLVISDTDNIMLACENAGLPFPNGFTTVHEPAPGYTEVFYSVALTAGQETILNSVMSDPNVGIVPATPNTVYTIKHLMDSRSTFRAVVIGSGLTCTVWKSAEFPFETKLIFNKVLTNAERNAVQAAYLSLFARIQG